MNRFCFYFWFLRGMDVPFIAVDKNGGIGDNINRWWKQVPLCCILSFGWFPGFWILCADVSEHSVCSVFIYLHRLLRWNIQSVPKRRHTKFSRRGIAHKKEYNIQNTAWVWSQEVPFSSNIHWWRILLSLMWLSYCVLLCTDPTDHIHSSPTYGVSSRQEAVGQPQILIMPKLCQS
jgi:hypothetical protein